MALSAKLELRQGQSLVMTPQLQQAIKLLQLSNLELCAFVEAELERNPLLERDDSADVGMTADERNDALETLDQRASEVGADEWLEAGRSAIDPSGDLDTDYHNVDPDAGAGDVPVMRDSGWASLRGSGQGGGEGEADLESYASAELSLHDHLMMQLGLAGLDPMRTFIGANLIDMVDEAGYLRGDLVELARRLGAPEELVESTLTMLQEFEPAGVFARSLAECLALQLKELNRYDPVIAALLDNLHLLAQHNMPMLKRMCGCDQDDLNDMIAEIRRLNPKPGLAFGGSPVQTVVPDVIVRQRNDGGWLVELNSETLPRVLVNQSYYAVVHKAARREADKGFLQECLQTANWLVKSLDQRARTILKVSEEIVRQQDAFLSYGIQHLRPLNLKTVADAIGMHESTVSRVTSNKYMATNRGIFELKYFFTSAIASADSGEAHSSEAVRHRIKLMIDAEAADDVLSDDKIVAKLKAEGVDIARRTVAKYREAMHIASSVQRRREKIMAQRAREIA